MNREARSENSHAEKSSEFQMAAEVGIRIGLLDQLEQSSEGFIKELRIAVSGLLLSRPVVPPGGFLIDNFRLIAEIIKYIEDEERRDMLDVFFTSLLTEADVNRTDFHFEKITLGLVKFFREKFGWVLK